MPKKENKKKLFLNAVTDLVMDKFAAAAQVFQDLLSGKPKEKALLIALAACLTRSTNLPALFNVLNRAVTEDPTNVPLLMDTANYALKMGQMRDAVDLMNRILELDPTNLFATINLSAVLFAVKRFDQIIRICDQGLRANPNDPSLVNNRGAATDFLKAKSAEWQRNVQLFSLNRPVEQALATEVERIKKSPEDVFDQKPGEGATYAAEKFVDMNDTLHALEMCEVALGANPQNGDAWLIKGFALRLKYDQDASLQALQKAAMFLPKRYDAWFHLGDMFLEVGRVDEAISAFKKALSLAPKDTNVLNNLSVAYRTAGNLPESARILEQLVDLNPFWDNAWNNLGAVYADMGELAKALKALDVALEINPKFEPAKKQRDAVKIALDRQVSTTAVPAQPPTAVSGSGQEPESKICSGCGTSLRASAKFCNKCGTKLR